MRKVLILIACIFSICAQAQQKLNRFHLVDQESGLAIPSVSVAIVKAKLLMTTEKDGIFIIPGDLKRMQDTIMFYVQNYLSLNTIARIE
jgi:hypothetical protein